MSARRVGRARVFVFVENFSKVRTPYVMQFARRGLVAAQRDHGNPETPARDYALSISPTGLPFKSMF
jgi:hypothetical protein